MNNNEYQVGGSLPIESPTYVTRQADEDIYQALKQSCYCYVLNCRQMGKSSLGVRTRKRLQNDGIVSAFIDLTEFGSEKDTTREKWYWSLIDSLLSAFQLWEQFDLETWWQKHHSLTLAKRFSKFVEEILLKKIDQPIVIFLDEIDSVLGLEYCLDDFFALIRYFYNQRAINPELKRLTFALLGVATPTDLIQDGTKTPFNIGMGIELQGFQLTEVQPLAEGLQKKADDTQAVMKEILRWTGGQPFLTQKLCQLVGEIDFRLTPGNERQQIEEVVRARIINNWEAQDDPPHLKTIKDRIVKDEKYQINLLETYRQILEKDEILANKIEAEIVLKLRLSGLVVQQLGKVKVYNEIYQAVFNSEWIDRQLETVCPYAQSMRAWFVSHGKDSSKLLRGKDLQKALQWKDDKNLSQRDYQYLTASKESESQKKSQKFLLIGGSVFLATIAIMGSGLGAGFWVYERFGSCILEKGVVGEKIENLCFRTLITSGEKRAFISSINFYLDQGIEDFRKGEYKPAIKLFEQAIEADRTDPIPQIYLNNTRARLKGKPLKLAVIVALDNYEYTAKEVLKGVADAQTEFNKSEGKNGRLLEIVIVNDGNEEVVAKKVAEELVKTDILGVIGHHASESSYAALPIYENAGVPMVSPTSSTSKLKSKVFFRAVQSTKEAAQKYAEYIKQDLHLDKIVVFYNKDSLYSKSLKEDFQEAFAKLGGKVIEPHILITDPQLDIEKEIKNIAQQKGKAAFLISSLTTNSVTIPFAKRNATLPSEQKLHLLTSMSLFEQESLEKAGNVLEGLTLASPCLAEKSDYMKQAANRWEQKTYWRVATSYDATQAFIEAIQLSKEPTREEILQNLHSLKLPVNKTSGFGLSWNSDHSNAKRKYCLFQIHNHKFEEILEK